MFVDLSRDAAFEEQVTFFSNSSSSAQLDSTTSPTYSFPFIFLFFEK